MSAPTFRSMALAFAALAAACSKEAPPPQRPAPQVTVVVIEPRDVPAVREFVAQTESSQQVEIVARVSGFLDKIAYQEGEVVKAGQLLFQLDPKPFQAQLQAARGELQAQQARLKTAQSNLGRVKPLAEQNAQLVKRIEVNRKRTLWLVAATLVLAIAVLTAVPF